jgi:hypothetical protein
MSISIDKIVNVSDSIRPTGVLKKVFGIGLFLTGDTTLGTGSSRLEVFSDFKTDMVDRFDSDSEPFKAGEAWFQQSPYPKNLIVARWFNQDTSASIIGGELTNTLDEFNAMLATGYISCTINDTSYQVNIDLTNVSSMNEISDNLQSKLTDAGAQVSVEFDASLNSFKVLSTKVGASSTLSYFVVPSEGVDLGGMLKLNESTSLEKNSGENAETIEKAISEILAIDSTGYFVMLDNNLSTDLNVVSVSDYIETTKLIYSASTTDTNTLMTNDTTSVSFKLFNKKPSRTFMTFSNDADYKAVSIAARLSSVNFDAKSSVITAKFKSLPGMIPDNISGTGYEALISKRVNYYTYYATDAIYAEGTSFNDSVYVDVRYALDWFVNSVQVAVYNLLRTSGIVSQTDEGEAIILNAIDNICQKAKDNGMISTGVVSEGLKNEIIQTTGNTNFDGVLSKGYLIWSQPTAAQSQEDRNLRKATTKKIWLKGAGAVHFADISIGFEN